MEEKEFRQNRFKEKALKDRERGEQRLRNIRTTPRRRIRVSHYDDWDELEEELMEEEWGL